MKEYIVKVIGNDQEFEVYANTKQEAIERMWELYHIAEDAIEEVVPTLQEWR